MRFSKKLDYKFISREDGKFTVQIIGKPGQTVTVDEAVGEVILDLNNDQYNSDHRFYRHQDSFFQSSSDEESVENDSFSILADRASIEATSTYGTEEILDQLIAQEDAAEENRLIGLLPEALATLTDKQRYVIKHFFLNGEKQNVIAKQMQVSPMMVHKHLESAKKKLQTFYETNAEK
ncbi:sigma-70 family RNA polymerase sigma factor [Limosilactobacillus ingluviei]|uniref:sigma-70 family RNA polymerase sigma factor n=1 Tax=Limosilactobacillus ingluviei TaxID=148604 RepID=UPI00195D05BF|nr:sigma-70 family RNA polymerase sigma factor [Limosilactobacillus ingluviei]MBM6727957.1 sigma-70 family RNA polymerase sigma factor [Limosilactobacillus ingluviei]